MPIPKYIQDPNNPFASIPNPAYDRTKTQAENDFNQDNLSSSNIKKSTVSQGVTPLPEVKTATVPEKPAITTETIPETTTATDTIQPKVSKMTLADLGLDYSPTEDQIAIDKAQKDIIGIYPKESPDEAKTREEVLRQFRGEIDALDVAKAAQLADLERSYQKKEERSLGSSRALLANTGMLGQVGGETIQQGIISDIERQRMSDVNKVRSDFEEKRQKLLSEARTTGETTYNARKNAFAEGSKALVDYIKSKGETRKQNTKSFVDSAIASEIDLSKEDLTEYAKSLGVSKGDILAQYNIAKIANDKVKAEAAKAEAERLKLAAETGRITAETGKLGAETSKIGVEKAVEQYKLDNPEKQYNNIKEVDGGLYDMDTKTWLVQPKGEAADWSYNKDVNGLVNSKTGEVKPYEASGGAGATAKVYANDTKISEIDNLLKGDSGILSAVGTIDRGALSGLGAVEGFQGKTQNFIAGVEQLVKEMTLDKLINAKAQGATFGALSEGELKLLSDSASKIGTWAVKDDKGNITGYNVDEGSFKKELQKIQDGLKLDKAISLGKQSGVSADEVRQTIIELNNKYQGTDMEGKGYDRVLEKLQTSSSGNTNGGGGTPTASSDAQSIVNAIKKTESSGNYGAKGLSGETGAYQFMPATFNAYAKEYTIQTGEPISGQTPENQDKIALFKVQQWIDKGYDAKQIASMWNAGEGRPDAWKNWKGVNAFGVAYDTPAYVNKVLSNLG